MNDEKDKLLDKEEKPANYDSEVSEIKLHLDEGIQTEPVENIVVKKHVEKSNNGCFYCLLAICLAIIFVPLIVYLERGYQKQ
jgi:hypothetical protein